MKQPSKATLQSVYSVIDNQTGVTLTVRNVDGYIRIATEHDIDRDYYGSIELVVTNATAQALAAALSSAVYSDRTYVDNEPEPTW